MKKLRIIAKNLDTMAATAFWIFAVAGGLALLGICITPFLPTELYNDVVTSVVFDFMEFEIAADYAPDANSAKIYLICGLAIVLIALIVACISIRIIRKILAPMKEGLPFNGTVSGNLTKLCYLTLIGGGLVSVVTLVHKIVAYKVFDLANLFASDKFASITPIYQLDWSFVVTFAILSVLSLIFRYGEALQKEADETL